jgi:hypothetical protein
MTDLKQHLLKRAEDTSLGMDYDLGAIFDGGHTYVTVTDWLLAAIGELEPAKPERLAVGTRVRFWRVGERERFGLHGTGSIQKVWPDGYTVTGDSTKATFLVSEGQVERLPPEPPPVNVGDTVTLRTNMPEANLRGRTGMITEVLKNGTMVWAVEEGHYLIFPNWIAR